jgi:sugar/nucleoside kinase (ribokinase family)
MRADPRLDLVCVSYLADTQLLRVAEYPPANAGAVVEHIAISIAADGPLAALTAARLGRRVGLIANAVGTDPAGLRVLDTLHRAGVRHAITALPDIATPQMTVVVDDNGTRTWFGALLDAVDHVRAANLHLLTRTRLIYLDCYRVLIPAAIRVISAAGTTPLLLNLGGDPVDENVIDATQDRHVAMAQTSLDEADAHQAEALADDLFARLRPDAAVVTLGRLGALARTRTGTHRAAAPPVAVTHTHGAGAAFSAGYAHALLARADIDAALHAGCQAGAAHCTTPGAAPRQPTAAPLTAACIPAN